MYATIYSFSSKHEFKLKSLVFYFERKWIKQAIIESRIYINLESLVLCGALHTFGFLAEWVNWRCLNTSDHLSFSIFYREWFILSS